MIIYSKIGDAKYDVVVNNQTKLKQTLKGLDKVTANFIVTEHLNLIIGDYILWRGSKYSLNGEPSVKKGKQDQYQYSIDFLAPKHDFAKALVVLDGKTEHYLFGTLQSQLEHILTNINRVTGVSYTLSIPVYTETQNVSYENSGCLTALDDVITLFDKEYSISGTVITVVDRIGVDTGLSFKFKQGLKIISRKKLRENELVTRLYAMGSERNITATYGHKRLRIDPIEKNVADFGLYEKTKVFEEIYPKRVGSVTGIGADIFYFIDTGMEFDLNRDGVLIQDHKALITFQTGSLQGYEFEVESYTDQSNTFKLIKYTDPSGFEAPTDVLFPEIGDQYIITGINMPIEYIEQAETELRNKANEYMELASFPTVVYAIDPDTTYIRENGIELNLGDNITIEDTDMGIDILTRVTELSQSLADPELYTLKVGNKTSEGFIRQLSNQANSIDSKYSAQVTEINNTVNRYKSSTTNVKEGDTDYEQQVIGKEYLKPEAKGLAYMVSKLKIYPNYGDNPNHVNFDACTFVHLTIDTEPRKWIVTGNLRQMTLDAEIYYIYIRANKGDYDADFIISTEYFLTDGGGEEYYFLIGVLSEQGTDGNRVLNAFAVGGGTQSINNITNVINEGVAETGDTISQKLYALTNHNQFTTELLDKVNSLSAGTGGSNEIPLGDFFNFKSSGSLTGGLRKNDVILTRLTDDNIYFLQYDGVGNLTFLSSYTIIFRLKINNLYP